MCHLIKRNYYPQRSIRNQFRSHRHRRRRRRVCVARVGVRFRLIAFNFLGAWHYCDLLLCKQNYYLLWLWMSYKSSARDEHNAFTRGFPFIHINESWILVCVCVLRSFRRRCSVTSVSHSTHAASVDVRVWQWLMLYNLTHKWIEY